MADARSLLEQLGATFDDDSVASLPFSALEIESVFDEPPSGDAVISLFSPEAFGFTEPPELTAIGPLWIAGLDKPAQIRSAIRDAHRRLSVAIDADRKTLVDLGFEPQLKSPEPQIRGTGVVAGHSLVVTIENSSLHLLRADGAPIPAELRKVTGAVADATAESVQKELGLKIKALIDDGTLKPSKGLFSVNTVRAPMPPVKSESSQDAEADGSRESPPADDAGNGGGVGDKEGTKKKAVRPRRKSRLRSQSAEAASLIDSQSAAPPSSAGAADEGSSTNGNEASSNQDAEGASDSKRADGPTGAALQQLGLDADDLNSSADGAPDESDGAPNADALLPQAISNSAEVVSEQETSAIADAVDAPDADGRPDEDASEASAARSEQAEAASEDQKANPSGGDDDADDGPQDSQEDAEAPDSAAEASASKGPAPKGDEKQARNRRHIAALVEAGELPSETELVDLDLDSSSDEAARSAKAPSAESPAQDDHGEKESDDAADASSARPDGEPSSEDASSEEASSEEASSEEASREESDSDDVAKADQQRGDDDSAPSKRGDAKDDAAKDADAKDDAAKDDDAKDDAAKDDAAKDDAAKDDAAKDDAAKDDAAKDDAAKDDAAKDDAAKDDAAKDDAAKDDAKDDAAKDDANVDEPGAASDNPAAKSSTGDIAPSNAGGRSPDMAQIWQSAKSASELGAAPFDDVTSGLDVSRTSASINGPGLAEQESPGPGASKVDEDISIDVDIEGAFSRVDGEDEPEPDKKAAESAPASDEESTARGGEDDEDGQDVNEEDPSVEEAASGFDDSAVPESSPHEAKTRMVAAFSISSAGFGSEIETRAGGSLVQSDQEAKGEDASAATEHPPSLADKASNETGSPGKGSKPKDSPSPASEPSMVDEEALEEAAREAADAAVGVDASMLDEDALVAAALAEADAGPSTAPAADDGAESARDVDVSEDDSGEDASFDVDLEVDLSSMEGEAPSEFDRDDDQGAPSQPTGEVVPSFDFGIADDDTELRPERSPVAKRRDIDAAKDVASASAPDFERPTASIPEGIAADHDPFQSLASVVGEGISTGKTGAIALDAEAFAALRGENSTEDDRAREEILSLRKDAEEFEARARELRDKADRLEKTLSESAAAPKPARSLADRVRKQRTDGEKPAKDVVAAIAGEDAVSLSAVEAALVDPKEVESTVLAPAANFSSLALRDDDEDDSVFGHSPAGEDAGAPADDGGFSESEANATRVGGPSIVDALREQGEDANDQEANNEDAKNDASDGEKKGQPDAVPEDRANEDRASGADAVAIIVTDSRVQGPLAEFLAPKLSHLTFHVDAPSADADYLVYVHPPKEDALIDTIAELGATPAAPRVLILSNDESWAQVAGVDHRVDLGARASEVASQVLLGLKELGYPDLA